MFDQRALDAITKVANDYGYEPAKLLAVAHVESAGKAFWRVNGKDRPAIRFEGHYFYARLTGTQLQAAINQGLANKKAGAVANPASFSARYTLLDRAMNVNRVAALESTSWGLGQVMGAHWKDLGYGTIEEFVTAQYTIEGQVEAMVRFIEKNNLKRFIDAENWTAFARAYNGPAYKKNAYDTKMAEAYKRFKANTPSAVEEDEVRQIQTMLNSVGSYQLDVDGVFGKNTKTALRDFQLKSGLKSDGIYGPLTRKALEDAYLEKSRTRDKNIGLAGSATSTIGVIVTETAKQIEPLASTSQIAQYVFLGVLVVGLLLTLKSAWGK